jgi:hypothetical protein
VLLISRVWWHVTWCWSLVKSGQGCWGSGGIHLSFFFYHNSRCETSASCPGQFAIGIRSHWIFRGPLVEATPACENADAHKPPHVLGRVATARLVHVDLCRSFILPHFSCTSCYGSTVLMFPKRHLWYCDCPALAVCFVHWTCRFVADCWCAIVRFSWVPGTRRPVLWTCCSAMHNTVSSLGHYWVL